MPAVIVRRNLLKQERIAVESEGEFVILHLGNVEARIPYETALLLSQWVRVRAKEAKRRMGDNSRHWSAIGTLTDASVTRG
jgi:hypothetical protein